MNVIESFLSMKILVTGGAGYIGNFMTHRLIDDGHEVTIADDLSRGHKDNLHPKAEFIPGDLSNPNFVQKLFSQPDFEAVFNFAGLIAVNESMQDPGSFFRNNVQTMLNILEQVRNLKSKKIIFSSTAAVYGMPKKTPISEKDLTLPVNPYGESKLMVEKMLKWFQKVYDISYVTLRYFNACGAALDGSMGEAHNPETHIIPLAIKAALNDLEFTLYGTDYQTPDGTCIRDYIHVLDLVEAHILALKKLEQNPGGYTYNVAAGHGYSNKEVLAMVNQVSGKTLQVIESKRRLGDPDELVANPSLIKKKLKFTPKYSDLKTIVESSWKWHSTQKGKKNGQRN